MSRFRTLFAEIRADTTSPVRMDPMSGLRNRGLSDEQARAVLESACGRVVITACPGAGKTFTLVERAAWLLRQGIPAEDIVLCTFTRAAAQELRKRVAKAAGGFDTRRLTCGTVHAIALRRLGGQRALATRGIKLVDEDCLESLVGELQTLLPEEMADWGTQEVLLWLGRARESLQGDALARMAAAQWQELLARDGLVDFTALLELEPPGESRRYRHVLVDEAQDLSTLQLRWLSELVVPQGTIYLVGDDDQSLYSFRGADSGLLARLVAQGAKHHALTRNFRSDTRIVAAANAQIGYVRGRLPSVMEANSRAGGSLEVLTYDNVEEEVEAVKAWASERTRVRILARTRALLAPFQAAGLPCSTIHEAKGLQWASVWVTGLEASQLPSPRSDRDDERRVFFVALTRAEHELVLASSRQRTLHDRELTLKPSPFLLELQGFGRS